MSENHDLVGEFRRHALTQHRPACKLAEGSSNAGETEEVITRSWQGVCGQGTLMVDWTDADPLACALVHLTWQSEMLQRGGPRQREQAAQRFAERIVYVGDRLSVQEADRVSGAVLLRSDAPERDDRAIQYLEVVWREDGGWTWQRYEKRPDQNRQPMPSIMTWNTLKRLVSDLATVLPTELNGA